MAEANSLRLQVEGNKVTIFPPTEGEEVLVRSLQQESGRIVANKT